MLRTTLTSLKVTLIGANLKPRSLYFNSYINNKNSHKYFNVYIRQLYLKGSDVEMVR